MGRTSCDKPVRSASTTIPPICCDASTRLEGGAKDKYGLDSSARDRRGMTFLTAIPCLQILVVSALPGRGRFNTSPQFWTELLKPLNYLDKVAFNTSHLNWLDLLKPCNFKNLTMISAAKWSTASSDSKRCVKPNWRGMSSADP